MPCRECRTHLYFSLSSFPLVCTYTRDNERAKWNRATLISRRLFHDEWILHNSVSVDESPCFAEYRVNVTIDLCVKNGNGQSGYGKNHSQLTRDSLARVHEREPCNYRSVASFQCIAAAISYARVRRSQGDQPSQLRGFLRRCSAWKKWQTTRAGIVLAHEPFCARARSALVYAPPAFTSPVPV